MDSEFCTADFSYESKINGNRSLIDHFLMTESLFSELLNADVLHAGDNLSDHSPIAIRMRIPVSLVCSKINRPTASNTRSAWWHKASDEDLMKYKQILDSKLQNPDTPGICCRDMQCSDLTHRKDIDALSSDIVNICLEAADISIPGKDQHKCSVVPGWSKQVEGLRQDALFWHSMWKQCNSPQQGPVADIRRRTRSLYHRAVKDCKRQKKRHESNSMAAALNNSDYKTFWASVKKHSRYSTNIPSTIDDANNATDIANIFADRYSDLYKSVPYDVSKMSSITSRIDNLIMSKCVKGDCQFNHIINVSDFTACVKQLKSNKSDGNEGLSSNHIIYGSSTLFSKITALCTAMLHHGYVAPNLRSATIIPIVKDKTESMNDSNNYRGIALSSILSKLLDKVIIQSHKVHLGSSDLQFGYKEKSSTAQCTFVVEEIVHYYRSNESNVYATFLDASKAFDRVRFDKLFELLIDKGVCAVVARLQAFMYCNQECRVKCSHEVSHNFRVCNGVKQGGVLSPLLFNIYIDVLLERLANSGQGCHVGKMFAGCLAYADDVVLLSPTVDALENMLKICEKYSVDFSIMFNTSKSKLLVFSENPTDVNVNFQGNTIRQVKSETHVGHLMSNSPHIQERRVSQACKTLIGQFNLLSVKLGFYSPEVLYSLFQNYCMSLYGCQLWDYSNESVLASVFVTWRKCVRNIFSIPYDTHCHLVHLIAQDSSVRVKLHKRYLKFFNGACNSNNTLVHDVSTCNQW